jgi:hypothetical protein
MHTSTKRHRNKDINASHTKACRLEPTPYAFDFTALPIELQAHVINISGPFGLFKMEMVSHTMMTLVREACWPSFGGREDFIPSLDRKHKELRDEMNLWVNPRTSNVVSAVVSDVPFLVYFLRSTIKPFSTAMCKRSRVWLKDEAHRLLRLVFRHGPVTSMLACLDCYPMSTKKIHDLFASACISSNWPVAHELHRRGYSTHKGFIAGIARDENMDDVEQVLAMGISPYYIFKGAIYASASPEFYEKVLQLPGMMIDQVGRTGDTLAHKAVCKGKIQVVSLLKKYGACFWLRNHKGLSVLDEALLRSNDMMVRTVITKENLDDKALHYAKENSSYRMYEYLLKRYQGLHK